MTTETLLREARETAADLETNWTTMSATHRKMLLELLEALTEDLILADRNEQSPTKLTT